MNVSNRDTAPSSQASTTYQRSSRYNPVIGNHTNSLHATVAKGDWTKNNVRRVKHLDSFGNGDERAKAWLKGKEHLGDAIAEAQEDGSDEPTEDAVVSTGKMFEMVDDLLEPHEIESVVTDDRDALTYFTDARKNYVMFNCTASGQVAVHFNIRSHLVFDSPKSVPEEFIRTLFRSMKNEPVTS